MRYKFTYPAYTGYSWVDSPIPSCAQTWENTDPSTYESSGLCPAILLCVLNSTPVGAMAMFAAGSTILRFIPTILSMVGTSRNDHLRIHKRFPILALLLSCCNPSTIVAGLAWRTETPPEDVLVKNHIQIDAYRGAKYIAVAIHGAALGAAALAIWQALLVGMRGVVSFACPTWYNPLFWLLIGPVAHIIDVTTSRCCLEGPYRWSWDLSAVKGVKIRWSWVMQVKDMVLTILGLADYVYGTVILSSTQFVGPRPAIQIAVVLTLPAIFAKLVSIFLLELAPEDHRDSVCKRTDHRRGDSSMKTVAEENIFAT